MIISKLKDIQHIGKGNNLGFEKYFPISTNEDKSLNNAFEVNDVTGQLISLQFSKQLKKNFTKEIFINNVINNFKNKINEDEYSEIINDIYFEKDNIPMLSPIMYMAKPYEKIDKKTKKSLGVFKQMLQKSNISPEFKINLNFIELEIYNTFNSFLEVKKDDEFDNSYLGFIDDIFTKDFIFLLKNQHYFKSQIDRFLKFYFFIYSAQLAINIHSTPLEKPKPQKLFFILNHEKASSERKNLINYGYKTLIEKVKYIFPYLSLLKDLSSALKIDDLKLYQFNKIDNIEENIIVIDEINKLYRDAKSIPESIIKSNSIDEAFNSLLSSTMEQFKSSSKKAVLDRFINAYEKQISNLFFQSRGRSGKVLILDQDTVLLLTNLAIGDNGQLRFQELMEEFKKRSIHFDPRSEEALLELYERVGNVNRKSDSGDAVYVRSI